ncbi:Ankyrin repeat domain-containing protein 13C [Mortierella sp. AD011]|nr:Ankyrin repeat domain-containing protein 13C [Mortierella sp. AD010]KAF9387372.1 Ankyrin repeat domain-containing protein 13C [Mortierella sp. AD011]
MASITVDPADPLALHKLVFLNKVQTLKMCLAPYKSVEHAKDDKDKDDQQQQSVPDVASTFHPAINALDNHLVTPLHLAVMLNRKEMVLILINAGANPIARSGSGWTPRQEATSLGNRELIEILTRCQRKEFTGSFKTKAMKLVKQLSEVREFQSWVPFVSGLCPNDTYHIWKKGNCVRMDTSLVGFENMKWIRGHISIIFRVDPATGPELVIVDRVKKITQRLANSSEDEESMKHEPTEEEIEEEVSTCFNSDITSTNVPTSAIKFQRAKAGLWGYRTNKVEKVGEYECAVWKMDGVEFRTRVRTEHLKDPSGKPIQPLNRRKGAQNIGGDEKGNVNKEKRITLKQALDDKQGEKLISGTSTPPVSGAGVGSTAWGSPGRRPQPLLATFAEPESMEESENATSAVGELEQAKQLALEKINNSYGDISASTAIFPKKHVRSTGTISDDAFFEAALQEAEGDMNKENGQAQEVEEDSSDDEYIRVEYRESLPPPPPPTITFDEYFDTSKQGELHLGRPLEQKESRKTFGATLWMYDNNNVAPTQAPGTNHSNASSASLASQDSASKGSPPKFPLTIEKILPLLEVVGMDNNRLVGKLKEFLEYQLPPGFPIRANIPVFPSLSADVTFVNYDAQRVIEDSMFEIPGSDEGYEGGFVIRPGGEDDT